MEVLEALRALLQGFDICFAVVMALIAFEANHLSKSALLASFLDVAGFQKHNLVLCLLYRKVVEEMLEQELKLELEASKVVQFVEGQNVVTEDKMVELELQMCRGFDFIRVLGLHQLHLVEFGANLSQD